MFFPIRFTAGTCRALPGKALRRAPRLARGLLSPARQFLPVSGRRLVPVTHAAVRAGRAGHSEGT